MEWLSAMSPAVVFVLVQFSERMEPNEYEQQRQETIARNKVYIDWVCVCVRERSLSLQDNSSFIIRCRRCWRHLVWRVQLYQPLRGNRSKSSSRKRPRAPPSSSLSSSSLATETDLSSFLPLRRFHTQLQCSLANPPPHPSQQQQQQQIHQPLQMAMRQ